MPGENGVELPEAVPNPMCEAVNPNTGKVCTDYLLGHAYCHTDYTSASWSITPENTEERCTAVFDGWRCLFPVNHWIEKGWVHQWYMHGCRIPSVPRTIASKAKGYAPWAHANELQWDLLCGFEEGVIQSAATVVDFATWTGTSDPVGRRPIDVDSEAWEVLYQNVNKWKAHMVQEGGEARFDNAELVFHNAAPVGTAGLGLPVHPEWTVTEAAKTAGVARSTIYRLLNEGKLPHAHRGGVNGTWLISVNDLNAAGLQISSFRSPNADPQWGTVHTTKPVKYGTCRYCSYSIHMDDQGIWQHDGAFPFNGTECWPD
jgi:excisionase family DNA binding protein